MTLIYSAFGITFFCAMFKLFYGSITNGIVEMIRERKQNELNKMRDKRREGEIPEHILDEQCREVIAMLEPEWAELERRAAT